MFRYFFLPDVEVMYILSTSWATALSGLWSSYKIELMADTAVCETWKGEARMPGQVWQVPSTQGRAAQPLARPYEGHNSSLICVPQKRKAHSHAQPSHRTNSSLAQGVNHALGFQMTKSPLELCFQIHFTSFTTSENLDLRRWGKSDS